MTRTERNKLVMYRAVDAVFSGHQVVIDEFPPLAEAVGTYRIDLKAILTRDQEFSGTKGVTAAKNSAVDVVIEYANTIANALYTYGRKVKSEEIKAACKVTVTELCRLTATELEKTCNSILESAQKHAADLVTYKISNEKITSFGQSLELFKKQLDSKDEKFAGSKAARGVLSDLFMSIDEILKEELDRMMEMVKEDSVDFYNKYKAARVIKDLGGSQKTKVKIEDAVVLTNDQETVSAK